MMDGPCYNSILCGFRGGAWAVGAVLLQAARLDVGNLALQVDAMPGTAWPEACHLASGEPHDAAPLVASMLRKLPAQQWRKALLLGDVTTAVAGNVLAYLGGAGRREEALKLCQELLEQKLRKDEMLLGVVLSLCDRADFWRDALDIFNSWPIKQGLVATGAAMASCGAAGQWPWCLRLLDVLGSASLVIVNSVVDAAKTNWKVSVAWLDVAVPQLGATGVQPDITTMNSAVSSMVAGVATGQWAKAVDPWLRRLLGDLTEHTSQSTTSEHLMVSRFQTFTWKE